MGTIEKAASDPSRTGVLAHLKLPTDKKVPEIFFLPGDPDRVPMFEEASDSFKVVSLNREYLTAFGVYKGKEFGVCSTGIGGGSIEIAIVELARLGVKVMIRTGGCGALQDCIGLGEIILNSAAVRRGGASINYVPLEFPATADPELVMILAQTCKTLGVPYHIGIGATVDSFYEGQGRLSVPGRPVKNYLEERINFLKVNRVLDLDMESETLFTLAYLFGIRAANILTVHGNRVTDEWLVDYHAAQKLMVRVALESLSSIS